MFVIFFFLLFVIYCVIVALVVVVVFVVAVVFLWLFCGQLYVCIVFLFFFSYKNCIK